jgi:hypothetical protein
MATLYNRLGALVSRTAASPLSFLGDLARRFASMIPEAWERSSFRRFWGEGSVSADAYFVMDSFENVRLRNSFNCSEMRPDEDSPVRLAGPDVVDGAFAPQAAAMLTALFLRNTGKVLRIATDVELESTLDATLICYGTPDANFKTFDIEAWAGSALCQCLLDGNGARAFRVAGRLHSIEKRNGIVYDKAIVLRLNNWQDSAYCHFVCAGLSEWGSLAAVRYLTRNWKSLHKRFDRSGRRRDFCLLLEVPRGQFEYAQEVISVVCWEPQVSSRPQAALAPIPGSGRT